VGTFSKVLTGRLHHLILSLILRDRIGIAHHREYHGHPSRTRLICMKSLAMRGWSVRNVSLCVADTADKMSAGILGH